MPKSEQLVVNTITRISNSTVMKGEIISSSDMRIDGRFEGRLFCNGKVVVGETASIEGDIFCSHLDLWGKVKGNLYVSGVLSLKKDCDISGDIFLSMKQLQVELGASISGNCLMLGKEEYDRKLKTAFPDMPVEMEGK